MPTACISIHSPLVALTLFIVHPHIYIYALDDIIILLIQSTEGPETTTPKSPTPPMFVLASHKPLRDPVFRIKSSQHVIPAIIPQSVVRRATTPPPLCAYFSLASRVLPFVLHCSLTLIFSLEVCHNFEKSHLDIWINSTDHRVRSRFDNTLSEVPVWKKTIQSQFAMASFKLLVVCSVLSMSLVLGLPVKVSREYGV